MDFGEATKAAQEGHRIARAGWNGKNEFVYHVPAASYPARTEIVRKVFGDMIPYQAYLAKITSQGNVVPWFPSQRDMLADDWSVVVD